MMRRIFIGLLAFAVAVIISAVLWACGVMTASVWGVGIAVLLGLGKMACDIFGPKHSPDFKDFVAVLFGVMAAIVVSMLLRI